MLFPHGILLTREKANPRVSLAPSHPANLALPRNVSVQAWFVEISCEEVVSVPVIGGVGSFDWNRHRQRRVLRYRRLHLLTHPIIVVRLPRSVAVLCPSECRRRRLPTHPSCSMPPTERR
ncbi:hypothetical protein LR48_Vigan08g079400 [Vigna angularis]|uniref:Uncharacterized protein n=1 Tax=Phaseolus angularis TaxID=3914 RepID=A0A0L9V4U1_PHAAN|nr:hypothetical protein LR48_Vigan08g079400 [Vigna angularis]